MNIKNLNMQTNNKKAASIKATFLYSFDLTSFLKAILEIAECPQKQIIPWVII